MADIIVDRTTYIKFGTDDPISTGIAEGSVLIDKILFTDDIIPGSFASSRFEIQIYGVGNVSGKDIKVYQIEDDQQIDLFTGRVASAKLDNAGYYRQIVAYDLLYFYARKNVADWFSSAIHNSNHQRGTYSSISSLISYLGIEKDSVTVNQANFSTGSMNIFEDSTVEFEKIALRDMLKYLLEPNGLICYINAAGQFSVYKPSLASSVDLTEKYDVNESTFEEYEVQPFQYVKLLNIDNSVVAQGSVSGVNSGLSYELAYNPIRLRWYSDVEYTSGMTYAEAAVSEFISHAPFQAYTPCDLHMIVSDMSIKLGDLVTTSKGVSYVSEIIYSGPMLIEQEIISRGSQVIEEVEEDYDPIYVYLDNKINETADALTEDLEQALEDYEPSEEYLEKVQEFSDAIANGMGLKTITRVDSETGARTVYYYAPDSNGAITNSTFIFTMKSTGFAWTNKWEGAPDASSESHTDPITGTEVSTTWTSGISANGNAILKILNVYKLSADIIDSGELVIRDPTTQEVVHKFSFDDLSASIGKGAITYNASTSTLNIDSSVIFGAATEAVADVFESQLIQYQIGNDATTTPSGTWLNSVPDLAANQGKYLWTRTKINPNTADEVIKYDINYIAIDGANGNDGTSITITSIQYGTSNSASVEPSNYSTTVPTSITKGAWLWVKTNYSNSTSSTTKSYVGTDGEDGSSVVVQSATKSGGITTVILSDGTTTSTLTINDGEDGDDGQPGADGSNAYVHIAWANSANGQTDFSTSVSTNKKYLGTYTDNTQADSQNYQDYSWTLIKGTDGSNGNDGKGISSITTYYKASTSATNAPSTSTAWPTTPSSSGFSETSKYLWSYTVTTYTDNSTVTSSKYVLGVWGTDGTNGTNGTNGTDGKGITSIVHQYCLKGTFSDSLLFKNPIYTTTFADMVKVEFVPPVTTTYVFQSTANFDTYGYIYTSGGTEVAHDDDSGGSQQFRISASLTAGTTYYLVARPYSSTNNNKNITATITNSVSQTDWSETPPWYGEGYEYYERDVITWTDGTTTYAPSSTGVKSNGINAAIRDANRANSAIGAWCYKNNKTYFDGGAIYTGTVTADALYANTTMTELLLAQDAIISGNLKIVQDYFTSSSSTYSSELTNVKNAYAVANGYSSYSNIPNSVDGNILKSLIDVLAATTVYFKHYLSDMPFKVYIDYNSTEVPVVGLNAAGLVVAPRDSDGLNGSVSRNAEFGINSRIPGNLTIGGNLRVSGSITGGSVPVVRQGTLALFSTSSTSKISENISLTGFSNTPTIVCGQTDAGSTAMVAYPSSITNTGFTINLARSTNASNWGSSVSWIATGT